MSESKTLRAKGSTFLAMPVTPSASLQIASKSPLKQSFKEQTVL